MNWSNNEIDRVKCISSFDISNDQKLQEAFNWVNTQPPLLKEVHSRKGTKFKFFDYRLQFFMSYQFFKLNEEGLN